MELIPVPFCVMSVVCLCESKCPRVNECDTCLEGISGGAG